MVYSLLTIDHQLSTEYIMKCPYCNSEIAEWYAYCGECGVNIADFSQGLQLLKEVKELEEEFDYTKAGEKYKEALELKIPKEEIRNALERLMSKQTRIIENIDKGKEYMTWKAYNRAVLSFKEVISLIPDDEDIKAQLTLAQRKLRQRRRKQRIVFAVFMIVIGGLFFSYQCYTQTANYIARKTLKIGLKAQDVIARRIAVRALGEVGDVRFVPLLKSALEDEDIIVRKRAVESLGKIDAPDIIPILREALFDKSKRVRISAAEALALKGDTSGIKFLKNILRE